MTCRILIAGEVPRRIDAMRESNGGSNGVKFEQVDDVAALDSMLESSAGEPLMVVAGPGADERGIATLREKHPRVPFVHDTDHGLADREASIVLQRYDQMRTDFLARLSHEVRSPLGVIVGVLGELEATLPMDDDTRQLLRLADRGVRRLRNLSESLMEVAELEALDHEQLAVDKQSTDLRDVIATAVERTQAAESRSNVAVEVRLPETPLTAEVDARRLERAVSTLVSNAVRFATQRVEVSLFERDGQVCIRVEDDGSGLPSDIRRDVFQRFIGKHLEGRKSGVAFGLSIAHDYVEAHGGTIDIDDARPDAMEGERRGARITVTLPKKGGAS